jgi:uncharacterized membrane protein
VICRNGVVELSGPVLEPEAPAMIAAARSTIGVHEVRDQLERHATAGNIAGLQGAPHMRARGRWSPAERLVVGSAGVGALGFGLGRQGVLGFGAMTIGGVALVRALANVSLAEAFGMSGRRPAIDVVKTVTVRAPAQDVFDLFTKPESFARFMRHVKEVRRMGENRWLWTVLGPAGVAFEWEGLLDRLVPNELVSWKSADGASIANQGSVAFETIAPSVTRLTIRLRYWPPLGLLGNEIAHLLGDDPKRELDEDMVRLKSLLEIGKTAGANGDTTLDEVRSSS